ncbi:uncharacterized protein [Hyperolius riggenbachi]|uniref:uncharacterized protein isoform X2 n=1 Tax=Hyperolius riggenbachi TaxID=752182 RepID=UPI0035A37719
MAPQRILITGCNRGIGLELVRQLLEQTIPPKQIFATCRNPDSPQNQKLNDLAARAPSVLVIKLDTTDAKSIQEAAKTVENHLNGAGLNVLINNAGITVPSTLESADADDFLHVYTTNVVGPLLVAKTFLPFLKKAAQENVGKPLGCDKSALINVSSELGSIENARENYPFIPVLSYRCSKAPLTVQQSVSGIVKVLDSLSEKHSGVVVDWEGNILEW